MPPLRYYERLYLAYFGNYLYFLKPLTLTVTSTLNLYFKLLNQMDKVQQISSTSSFLTVAPYLGMPFLTAGSSAGTYPGYFP